MRVFLSSLLIVGVCAQLSWAQQIQGPGGGDQKFQGFNLSGYNDSGEKAWDVTGETANVAGSKIELTNVNANSYGKQAMNVKADKGTVDQASGDMKLQKDVIITSEDGSTLMSDSVNWNKNKDLVSSNDKVFIKNKRLSATGEGMTARPGLKKATINKDVTVKVDTNPDNESKNKLVTITSDGPMVIDQLLSKARFEKNVVAVQEDQTLKADVIEVYFDEKMQNFKKIVCIGNVEIIRGENKTYAEKATYDAADQKITLSGRPKLIFETQGKNGFTAFGN